MIIDNRRMFDTEKDEEVWTKIIKIDSMRSWLRDSYHVVKYYKTEDDEEYYLFEYIMADNNGMIVTHFRGEHWSQILEQFDINDNAYIYCHDIRDKNDYPLILRGKIIKNRIKNDCY
ncbi:hypothetical protein FDC49_01875 [Clostridium sporogenes]|uniref:hypothetical protein n=1 Tax=Clostridium sporogenes TaxID=1509 RepID=UPI0013D595BE|nr:hypothetical protein [Clostridium sporogenes]NFG97912.1 hypothetical protein [Clostridium sporogenes]NFH30962.1 hypothetical protein [Clostridium sporogenes]NFL18543.1 hypothetical protein [Clostridium sporogenes]NFN73396.1 hypothetical protein [Clostridium sporogenes]NFV23592.1 hypothetical protein [Clostridium sporogenes]